jgi:hypothetical protein
MRFFTAAMRHGSSMFVDAVAWRHGDWMTVDYDAFLGW